MGGGELARFACAGPSRITVIPIVLGGGIPLFAAVEGQQSLKLVEAKTYPDGLVMLNY